MGRPPYSDNELVKKRQWIPEEDIILAAYIQQHGPKNWRDVPTNTGLLRCSKSCRLRWINYLRPGIKRGNYTEHEDNLIIHLQALFGNKWSAIASYLPQRTANDIKNYWNTHLKKKLQKVQSSEGWSRDGLSPAIQSISRGQWERRLQTDIHKAKQTLCEALSPEKTTFLLDQLNPSNGFSFHAKSSASSTPYAASVDNIAKLMKRWVRKSPKSPSSKLAATQHSINKSPKHQSKQDDLCYSEETPSSKENNNNYNCMKPPEAFQSLSGLESFDSSNSLSFDFMSYDEYYSFFHDYHNYHDDKQDDLTAQMSLIEKWLFDE